MPTTCEILLPLRQPVFQHFWKAPLYCLALLALVGFPESRLAVAKNSPPSLTERFDGPELLLAPKGNKSSFRLLKHEIDPATGRHGNGCERVSFLAPAGTSIQFAYSVPKCPTIREFEVAATVSANRPGMQLAVKVVLPRTVDAATRRPAELLVRSGLLGEGTAWEELVFRDLPMLLERNARVARMKRDAPLDTREAYVSEIVVLAPGGIGATSFLIDRLEVGGIVGFESATSGEVTPAQYMEAISGAQQQRGSSPLFESPTNVSARAVDPPDVPRAIQWQGEPFPLLAQLGFNTVWFERDPTAEELAEANSAGLAVICPPPGGSQITEENLAKMVSVMAWNLGEALVEADLSVFAQTHQRIERYDRHPKRFAIIASEQFPQQASRIADVLLFDRPVLATDYSLGECAAWLSQHRRLARPGTTIWTAVETELPANAAAESWNPSAACVSYAQLAGITSAMVGGDSRGFLFKSQTPLSTGTVDAQQRAHALELCNLRLGLIEAWQESGKALANLPTSDPNLSAIVLQAERSHLLVPVWTSSHASSLRFAERGPISVVLPNVPETSDVYLIRLGGIQPLRKTRVTGGVRIEVNDLPFDSFILLSDDPRAISQVTEYLRRRAPRAIELRQQLAENRVAQIQKALVQYDASQLGLCPVLSGLQQATLQLQDTKRYVDNKNFDLAYQAVSEASRLLDRVDFQLTSQGASFPGTEQKPVEMEPASTPTRASKNLLATGSFEQLGRMVEAGWKHLEHPQKGVISSVRLAPDSPRQGTYCLEFEVRSTDPDAPTPVITSPAVWIDSAPIAVEAGDVLEISGYVRIRQPLTGSVEGLQLRDTESRAAAVRHFLHAPNWRPFRIVRKITAPGNYQLTIALSGIGKVHLDELAILKLQAPNEQAARAATLR